MIKVSNRMTNLINLSIQKKKKKKKKKNDTCKVNE